MFSIDYQTRTDSKEFLQNPDEENDACIDFYYMHKAYETIDEWFNQRENDVSFDKNDYRSKLKFHTKVIWYLPHPLHLVGGFKLFCDTFLFGVFFYQPRKKLLCLFFSIGEVGMELARSEKIEI